MSDHSGRSVLPKKFLKTGKKKWCFLPRGPTKRLRPPLIRGLLKSPDALAGVFSSGSWSHERRQAYDQIVAMLKKLPVTPRLRN